MCKAGSKYTRFALYLIPYTLYLFFASCQTDIQTIKQVTSFKNLPGESMKEAEILYSDSAKVKMKLTAPQMDRYSGEKPYIEMPQGMKMFFYNDSLKVNAWMKADYGIRYEKEGKMEAKRNVEVVNVKGDKLNTERLILDEPKDSIYTDAFVKITTKDEVLWGNGLESNRDFSKYVIKNIKGIVNIKDEPKNNNP